MRRVAVLALAVAAVLAIPASSAFAVNSPQQFSASVSPAKGGTKAKPTPVTLKVRPYFGDISADAAAPFATQTANVFFPSESVFNGKFFPSCANAKVLTAANTCPAASKVGTGTAAGLALGITENLKVTIYNGPGGNKVELLVDGTSPLTIHSVIEGTLTKQTGKYGYKLSVPIPGDLQQPAPGAVATLTDFNTTLPAKFVTKGKKKIPYLGAAGCATGKWAFGYTGQYTDGTSQTVEITQPCKK
jgi:hypothetical protein